MPHHTSNVLRQVILGILDDGDATNAMWVARSANLFVLTFEACHQQNPDCTIKDVHDLLLFDNLQNLVTENPSSYPGIEKYLLSIPSYIKNQCATNQKETTLDNHGYLQMQLTRFLHYIEFVQQNISFKRLTHKENNFAPIEVMYILKQTNQEITQGCPVSDTASLVNRMHQKLNISKEHIEEAFDAFCLFSDTAWLLEYLVNTTPRSSFQNNLEKTLKNLKQKEELLGVLSKSLGSKQPQLHQKTM